MKRLVLSLSVLVSLSASAQTLFYYGKDSVTAPDFLAAYQKNNTKKGTEKSFRDYLDLYITSRLKIRDARDRGYDTLPQMISDLENLRNQIIPSYLNDKSDVEALTAEAFTRSQQDIHIAHLFIAFTRNGHYDTTAARRRAEESMAALSRGQSFEAVARQFSDDPTAVHNGGDIGFITAFSLPYDLENLAYGTRPGTTSTPFRSKGGYHIFKNLGTRKALGRIKASQILLAFPPGSNEADKKQVRRLADSLYNRIMKDSDFGKLAATFSNDMISAASNGQLQEFGVGEYDLLFEKTVYGLQNGAVSKPFETAHGIHIVKKLSVVPVASAKTPKAMQVLEEKVLQSDRMATAKSALAARVMKKSNFRTAPLEFTQLWKYTDSALGGKAVSTSLSPAQPLMFLNEQGFTVTDWINFAQSNRYRADGSGIKPYPQLWDEFVQSTALNYYQSHLEQFNDSFRRQLEEFRDGNLFFEIMQKQVWEPAQSDSSALLKYYQQNVSRYKWGKSAEAIVFYANDPATAKSFRAQLLKNPAAWRALLDAYSEKVAADSGRFDWSAIPNAPAGTLTGSNAITIPLINKTDNSASFAYLLRVHTPNGTKTFSEAKGLVVNDYQQELENQWLVELRARYPVKVNEDVLKRLIDQR
jgi:peptidyl-prolyl cis-trans isomerase SurA